MIIMTKPLPVFKYRTTFSDTMPGTQGKYSDAIDIYVAAKDAKAAVARLKVWSVEADKLKEVSNVKSNQWILDHARRLGVSWKEPRECGLHEAQYGMIFNESAVTPEIAKELVREYQESRLMWVR